MSARWLDVDWLTRSGRRSVRVLGSIDGDGVVSVESVLENVKPLDLERFSAGERLCLYGAFSQASAEATQVLPPSLLIDSLDHEDTLGGAQ